MSHTIDAPGSTSFGVSGSGADNKFVLWNGTDAIDASNMTQAAGGDLTFTGGGLAIDSGETIGVSSTTTTPGTITYYSDFGGRLFFYSGGG